MVICHIITSLVYGGAERLLVKFSNIHSDNHEIHVIYLKGEPKLKESFDPRITIHHIPLGWNCSTKLRSLVKEINPDIVHTQLGHADIIGFWACRGLPVKLFCSMQNVYFKWNRIDQIIFFIYSILFRTVAKNCKVIAMSKEIADHLENTLHVPKHNIRLIPNAIPDLVINESKNQLREELNIPSDSYCILFIGRLAVQKSVETLLYAVALIKNEMGNFKIIILGEGVQENYLKQLSRKLDIMHLVEFRGTTMYPEKYVAASDVFVLPSVFEGLSTVILEAFRSELPVIGSNISGINELITDGENGLLFEPENHNQLANLLLKLYTSADLRKQIGHNGYESYKNKYDINNYAKQIEELYLETEDTGQSRLKIVQVITSLVFGGAEKLLVNFSNVLVDKHDIHIIYLKGEPKLKSSFDPRIKIYHVPLDWSCAKNIRSLVKKIKPDVVHTHLGHADLIGMYACRGLPVKLYCTMHNVYFKWNWIDNVFFFLYYTTFKTHGKKCKVSCVSNAIAEHVHKRLGVSRENIRINYNSIPEIFSVETKEQARKSLSLNTNDFCLLTVGRLSIQKSHETLLNAIALIKDKIKELRVLIVGEGDQEQYLKELAEKLNITTVIEFRGGTQTPEKYYSATDVFILPSVFEGLPTVVLEAFRSSLPVIASNIDGTNELIEDKKNGLLFESTNYHELAEQILQLYESPELRKQIGENGYKSYKNKYDIKNYAKQIETLYLE